MTRSTPAVLAALAFAAALGWSLESSGGRGPTSPPAADAPAPAAAAPIDTAAVASELRRGMALVREGRPEEGAAVLETLRPQAGPAAGWVGLLAAEALAPEGDTARVRALTVDAGASSSPLRAQRARIRAALAADDPAGARALAEAYHARAGTDEARAAFTLDAARAALEAGDRARARADARAAAEAAPGSPAARQAAELLREMGGLSPDERLALARVDDRRGADARAAAGYRAWLDAGRGTPERRREVRLALGRAYFEAGRYAEAERALRPLFGADATTAGEAMYLAGRALYRRDRDAAAREVLVRLADRHPTSPLADDALFLVADLSHDAGALQRAAALYARAAREHPAGERSGLARMRLAGMRWLARDYAGAARWWEEQVARGAEEPYHAQSLYWAGRARARLGDEAGARQYWQTVRREHPLSYYAVLASERLGEPFWPPSLAPSPPATAEGRAAADRALVAADVLRAADLTSEAEAETDRVLREPGTALEPRYALAEALLRRGLHQRGIRMGIALQGERDAYDERLLRILYPFPFRESITAQARRRGLDPFVVAALTRQESTFEPRIVSWAGARGLMQVMPATGRGLARGAGIRDWDAEMLFDPEVNVRLGTRFLADQMRRYDERLPFVFSAYNAGPGRVERWKSFPEAGDDELFTERIPFAETRSYVKILTRNAAVYRGLYGGEGGG